MTTIVVLFNLRPEVAPETYEAWAKRTDLPLVRAQGSVAGFDVLRSQGLLGSDAKQIERSVDIDFMRPFRNMLGTRRQQRRQMHDLRDFVHGHDLLHETPITDVAQMQVIQMLPDLLSGIADIDGDHVDIRVLRKDANQAMADFAGGTGDENASAW